jgi:hypothetical protein
MRYSSMVVDDIMSSVDSDTGVAVTVQEMIRFKADHPDDDRCPICSASPTGVRLVDWIDCYHWSPHNPIIRFTPDGLKVS